MILFFTHLYSTNRLEIYINVCHFAEMAKDWAIHKCYKDGSVVKSILLFHRSRVGLPAPMSDGSHTCNSSCRGKHLHLCVHTIHRCTCIHVTRNKAFLKYIGFYSYLVAVKALPMVWQPGCSFCECQLDIPPWWLGRLGREQPNYLPFHLWPESQW